jgi:RNA polymerase sigma-70 factor (ECF subfamily)
MATTLDALIPEHRAEHAGVRVDHAELAAQLETLHPHSFGWALACCGRRREDAEDLLQDVYVKVLGGQARFEGRSTLKTWLFGIIRQTARARLRRDRLRVLLGLRHAARIDTPTPATSPDDDAVAADRRDRTRSALARLAARQREALQLVFYHDLTIDEAAKVMDVSLGSARVHYQRGKRRMASLLAEEMR